MIIAKTPNLPKLEYTNILTIIQNCPLKTQKEVMRLAFKATPEMLNKTEYCDITFEFKAPVQF